MELIDTPNPNAKKVETDLPIDDMSTIMTVSGLIKNWKSINDISDIPIE